MQNAALSPPDGLVIERAGVPRISSFLIEFITGGG